MGEARFSIRIAGKTDTGVAREHNEDFIGFDEAAALAVVADGLGGRASGEIASCMAVTSILTELRPDRPAAQTDPDLRESLTGAIHAANRRIHAAANANKSHNGMSTTLIAARIDDRRLLAGCVGDSRLYLMRRRQLEQLSSDHTLAKDLLAKGEVSGGSVSLASIDHILTRALGVHAEVEVDFIEYELEAGDVLLLCSDGLYNMVADWQLKDILNDHGADIERGAFKLVDHANRNGGKDNIAAVLMHVAASA
ncbi:MAG: protein phosphatase 2C domain-containing protein [Gammaproteobacteria bacterium]|nr:protein phosphatase 2C domain-containing protein [Gammaproteobacteria bacterium]